MGSACSVWATLDLTQLKAAWASQVCTAQALGCSARGPSEVALCFMHFPVLNQVLNKGIDSVECAFCALPRSEQLRRPGLPRWAVF